MRIGCGLAILVLPLMAQAGGFAYGLSDQVIEEEPKPQVEQNLQRQRDSGPPEQGELSAQVYVDTQKRISETFQRPVPEQLSELNPIGN